MAETVTLVSLVGVGCAASMAFGLNLAGAAHLQGAVWLGVG